MSPRFHKVAAVVFLASCLTPAPARTQDLRSGALPVTSDESRNLLAAVKNVLNLVQDVTRRHATDPLSKELQFLSSTVDDGQVDRPSYSDQWVDDLVDVLFLLRTDFRTLRMDLGDERPELSEDLDRIEKGIDDALRIARSQNSRTYAGEMYRPGAVQAAGNERIRIADRISDRIEDRYSAKTIIRTDINHSIEWDDRDTWRRRRDRWRASSSAFAGELARSWPYAEQSAYREIPGIRYNRVEGLVLGLKINPMDWSSYERAKIYGQGAYAFELKDWRYEIGAEARMDGSRGYSESGLKIGASYIHNTATNDLWKSSWGENSLASSLFGYDFFDYYEVEGWTAYMVGRITPYIQATVGYRRNEYRSLQQETSWSLFGRDEFRHNPEISEGNMNSILLTLEGGRVHGYRYRPDGFAFRFTAELGKGLGGDYSYNTFIGDIRTYLRMTRSTGFDIRFRGGLSEGDVPLQRTFTLGGVGTVRSYPQNVIIGSRMLLANVEYTVYRQDFFDDFASQLSVFGLFDAGWSNGPESNRFEWNDVVSSAGFGLALDDRAVRLELAWPLKDIGTGTEPSLWLRVNPTF